MNLNQHWIDQLVKLPETGMGYQVVKVTLKNNQTAVGLVINCEKLIVNNQYPTFNLGDISKIEMY